MNFLLRLFKKNAVISISLMYFGIYKALFVTLGGNSRDIYV